MSRPVLDAAAFLDSEFARSFSARDRRDLQTVTERWLRCCYEDLGKMPKLMDREDLQTTLGTLLPRRFGRGDPLAAMVRPTVAAYLEFLIGREVVPQAYELRAQLENALTMFDTAVADGSLPRQAPPAPTVVHRADKVGRNDPCPCGSGRKFKKCCARLRE